MEQEVQKKEVALNNESYKERFQFILSLNENIICQRYFRINGFNNDSLESYELRETIDEIVGIIRQDLESKSRVYQWFTRNIPLKLTGFGTTCMEIFEKTSTATYLEYTENAIDYYVKNMNITGTIITAGSPSTQVAKISPAPTPITGGKIPNTLGIS